MIDEKEINRLLEERKSIPAYNDMGAMDKAEDIFIALGDDEEEVFEFLSSVSDDDFKWFNEIYEEIIEKFQSDRIEEIFIKRHKSN